MTFEEIRPVMAWVRSQYTHIGAMGLVKALNEISWDKVPPHLGPALTGFRRRRQDARLALTQRFIWLELGRCL